MDAETLRLLIPTATMLLGVGAIYGAVRADIRHMVETIQRVERDVSRAHDSATKAHERLDAHVLAYHKGN